MTEPTSVTMEKIVSLSQRRGFIFPSSEIYGGLSSCWDYGPLGVELKRNVKQAWWSAIVQGRDDVVGLDTSIIMHPKVWEASGHIKQFSDPLVECKQCNGRFRADQIWVGDGKDGKGAAVKVSVVSSDAKDAEKQALASVHHLQLTAALIRLSDSNRASAACPACGAIGTLTEPHQFNLMFKTFMGPVEDAAAVVYLRPETAQGIFVNFQNVLNTTRKRLPFGIAQTGKSFRNEITTGNFIFRSREFEQMELEFFVKPGTDDEWFKYWVEARLAYYVSLGIKLDHVRLRQHEKEELAHYAKGCFDVEYLFPIGWSELEGIANRGDYDLTQHSKFSGKSLDYFDDETKERFIPYVIEPSAGVDRTILALLCDAYEEQPDKDEIRTVLHFHPSIAPIKVAILPLSRKEPLVQVARQIHADLRPHMMAQYDDTQSIGRRYRRQDEIGTPFSVTIDFQSLEDKMVTVRDRDSMNQIRIPIASVRTTLQAKLAGEDFLVVPPGGKIWKEEIT